MLEHLKTALCPQCNQPILGYAVAGSGAEEVAEPAFVCSDCGYHHPVTYVLKRKRHRRLVSFFRARLRRPGLLKRFGANPPAHSRLALPQSHR
jgi:hypothetical protein